ncbi:dUTP diphosphatase [Buchnera aphidicola]|nr:dUTP diphosphatase [Buchnera aphidicola]
MDLLEIKIEIIDPRLKTDFFFPEYLSNGFFGFFLIACLKKPIYILSEKTLLISTGILINLLDSTTRIVIEPLVSIKKKYNIIIGNPFGIIDICKDELKISLWNRSNKSFYINPGDKVAQLLFISNKRIKLIYI